MSERCSDPCAGGCDLGCEAHVTWTPDPRKQHAGGHRGERTSSTRFLPRGDGGGLVEVASLSREGRLGIWNRVAKKRPMTAAEGR